MYVHIHLPFLLFLDFLLPPRPPQALEAQEQEMERLRLPQQNPSPVPCSRRSGSPRSDRTPSPEPQSSPSPAASIPDLTNSTGSRSTPPPAAPELIQNQTADPPPVNEGPERGVAPMNGEEQVTPSKGLSRFPARVSLCIAQLKADAFHVSFRLRF